ncbi:Uncharacterised protein [Sphingobacterium multivorum]|jgi:hypothetical protein|nr:hypothetical protein [Sphingobacterium multivorum]SUJ21217.1 Uncharacterised protein [Sphingobacterium multivorum]
MDVHAASHFFLFDLLNMMWTKVASLPVSKDIEFKQIIVKIKQACCEKLKAVCPHVF